MCLFYTVCVDESTIATIFCPSPVARLHTSIPSFSGGTICIVLRRLITQSEH